MFCTRCGTPLEEGSRFCAVCGSPAPTAAVPVQSAVSAQPAAPAQPVTTDDRGVQPSVPPCPVPASAFDAAAGGQPVAPPQSAIPAPPAAAPQIAVPAQPVIPTPPPVAAQPIAVPPGYPAAPVQPPYPAAVAPAQYTPPPGYPAAYPPPFAGYAPPPAAGRYAPDDARSSTSAGVPAYQKQAVHSRYRTPDCQPSLDPVPAPQPEDPVRPLTFWQVVGCYLALFCLPVGNIIFACVWGFRAGEHPQRRTLALAALPFIAVGLITLFCVLLWATVNLKTLSITLG